MTDGPFRNATLSSRWKQYGVDLVSDAVGSNERTARASDSMIDAVDIKAFKALFNALRGYAQCPQVDLDSLASVETIFDSHQRSVLTDALQRYMTVNLRGQISTEAALNRALTSTVREWISTEENRIHEECIRARDNGDMSREEYQKGIERNRATFDSISAGDLCDALTSGNKRAFKSALKKKIGIDEGPDE